jgi:hypothetical protein
MTVTFLACVLLRVSFPFSFQGGIGTFYPLFYALAERARKADAAQRKASLAQTAPAVQELVHKA